MRITERLLERRHRAERDNLRDELVVPHRKLAAPDRDHATDRPVGQ